jgi:DNA-binding transcriptional MerR regulator
VQEPWTIAELAELAAETLAATDPAGPSSGQARADGRVRDVPNERLVRWYVTVGLVDPPLSRRGRVARYGRRHLLQLVAVKRRQAEGRSLAEVQAELAGATDETLAAVARVPDVRPASEAPLSAPARFWARQSGRLTPGADQRVLDDGRPDWSTRDAGASDTGLEGRAAGLVRGVRLAPGVTLLLEGVEREPGLDDVTEIINAARPLLAELASRRLRMRAGHPADVPGPSPEVGDLAEEGGHDH